MTKDKPRLRKGLKLFDVYVISTGAMFSSGFFLLPGLAAAKTGPSVVLAYFLSGLLILPAMLSKAELTTAMPKAGGAYYFLDRTLGPMVGTIGGLGTWLALTLKSAFALIGMGAYLSIFFHIDIKMVALGFTAFFALLNIVGARETTGLLRILVIMLVAILSIFILHGLSVVLPMGMDEIRETRFTPFFSDGFDGLLGTVGLVFVSYVGLTKVASVAEEVENPDRNIPLGMMLSLLSVVTIYVLGVFIMVAVLGVDSLSQSLTPAADAAIAFFTWIPPRWGQILVVVAACAAFASMSNAGVLAASRYPLAMARDRLVPQGLAKIGRFHTPTNSVLLTTLLIAVAILTLDVVSVAKMASALQLVLFALMNVAVIVMRESRIDSYDPGFRAPLYPWVQLIGVIAPFVLIAEMGWLPVLFAIGVAVSGFTWYTYYARERIVRDGAIFHVFERLGKRRFAGLDQELRDIIKEKGMRAEDPFDEAVARAFVLDEQNPAPIERIILQASHLLEQRLDISGEELEERFTRALEFGGVPVGHGLALFHTRVPGLETNELAFCRCSKGIDATDARLPGGEDIHAVFFLVSGSADPGRHLRILAHLAGRVEDDGFLEEWLSDEDEQDLKETLLRDDRFLNIQLRDGHQSATLIGTALRDLRMPEGCLVALIRRQGVIIVPRGATTLRTGDRLTIIGEPVGLSRVVNQYGDSG